MKEVENNKPELDQKKKKQKQTNPFAPVGNNAEEADEGPIIKESDLLFAASMWDFLKEKQKENSEGYKLADNMGNKIKKQLGYDLDNPEKYNHDVQEAQKKWESGADVIVIEERKENVSLIDEKIEEKEPVFGAPREEFELKTMSRIDLKKNNDQINRLYSILDSKDHWYRGSSDNFRELMKELKTLKSLSKELTKLRADHNTITDPVKLNEKTKKEKELFQKYIFQAANVRERAEIYIEGKKDNINSPYAKARFEAVTELKDIISANSESVEKTFAKEYSRRTARISDRRQNERSLKENTKILSDWYKNTLKKYALFPGNHENRKSFMGENYTEQDLEKIKANTKFSITRTAAHSISVLALLCNEESALRRSRYKLEDIMDPSKLQKEKQEMFKKVIEKMTSGKKEDKEWIAEKMVRGYEHANGEINKLLAGVNFKKQDYIYTDNFTKASLLSGIMMDVWQETENVKEEITAEANKLADFVSDEKNRKELPKETQKLIESLGYENVAKKMTFEEYHAMTGLQRGYLDQFSVNIQRLAESVEGLKDPEKYVMYGSSMMTYAYTVNTLRDDFARKALECGSKPHEKWFTYEEAAIGRGLMMGSNEKFVQMQVERDVFMDNLASFLNGRAFSNFSYKYDPNSERKVVINGNLDDAMLVDDRELSKMSDDEVLRRIDNQMEYYNRLKKTSGPDVREYLSGAIRAMSYLSRFTFSPRDMQPEERENAARCIKDIFSCHVATELSKTGLQGEALKKEVDNVVKTVPEYKRYMDALGKHALAGIMISDVSGAVADSKEVQIAKGKIYENKILNGQCKNLSEVKTAFIYAYATALINENGHLPFVPDRPGRRYTIGEFVDYHLNSKTDLNEKESLKMMMKNPDIAKVLLTNKNGLREYSVKKDKEVTDMLRRNAEGGMNNDLGGKGTNKTSNNNKSAFKK